MRLLAMPTRLQEIWENIRSSYWFVPSLMALAAILLAALMVWVDVLTGADWLGERIGWYQSIKPSGARDVLSTIAGSTLTVAGTAFSVTIAAISFASGQFGARLLTNFMGDRGNTLTLGTFVATFLYCLFVLRTIREGDDENFVPQLAVLVGMLLALASVAMLIYFIHHVPQTIHINNVIAGIGRQLVARIDRRFPDPEERAAVEEPAFPVLSGHPARLPAPQPGYLQIIEEEELVEFACEHRLLLRMTCRNGEFVAAGRPLLEVWPAAALTPHVAEDLRELFVIGDQRTPHHDLGFLMTELVEIAGRALSSGVNDPMTATACIDWMGAALSRIAARELPPSRRCDRNGELRLIAPPLSFEGFLDQSFGRLRQYSAPDAIAAEHSLLTLGRVAADCRTSAQVAAIDGERRRLIAVAEEQLGGPSLERIKSADAQLRALLAAA